MLAIIKRFLTARLSYYSMSSEIDKLKAEIEQLKKERKFNELSAKIDILLGLVSNLSQQVDTLKDNEDVILSGALSELLNSAGKDGIDFDSISALFPYVDSHKLRTMLYKLQDAGLAHSELIPTGYGWK